MSNHNHTLHIIGAGLGRTGTSSLQIALNQLGFGPTFHMRNLMQNPPRLRHVKELMKNGQTDFAALFEGYHAAVDYPTCLYVEPILQAYPNAKVILTVRDPEKWYTSVKNTLWQAGPRSLKDILKLLWNMIKYPELRKVAPVFKLIPDLIWNKQFQGKFEDKAFALQEFEAHSQRIRNLVPEGQLLEYSVKDGWEPLCRFLGVPVPDVPFPHANNTEEFTHNIKLLKEQGIVQM